MYTRVLLVAGLALWGAVLAGCSIDDAPNAAEPRPDGVEYISKDPAQCAVLRFACDEGAAPFSNTTGCGCLDETINPEDVFGRQPAAPLPEDETPMPVEPNFPIGGPVPGEGTEQKPCTREFVPVCGDVPVQCITAPCDPVQQTFPNKCVAENAGAQNITNGPCSDDTSSTPPERPGQENPVVCTMEYAPVCATNPETGNRKTYGNSCEANVAGATNPTQGECSGQ